MNITSLLVALLASTIAGAAGAAGPVYKCQDGGKVGYSDRPCANGPSIELEPRIGISPEGAESVPTRDARTLLELEKLKIARDKELQRAQQQQEKQQEKRAQAERREHERLARAAGQRRKQCARLKLRHQWALDDAARAKGPKREAALLKARRQSQNLAVECPA